MTREERAAQIWPILTLCAAQRQTLTYGLLGKHIGMFQGGLGQLLEPIQSYCLLKCLPALSSLVVSDVTGLPGEGFIAASDVPGEQARVFRHDWRAIEVPDAQVLGAAVTTLPSNGRALAELLREVEALQGHHEGAMPTLELKLQDAYWSNGFFNVSVDYQRFITTNEGPFDVYLGDAAEPIVGRISRSANYYGEQ